MARDPSGRGREREFGFDLESLISGAVRRGINTIYPDRFARFFMRGPFNPCSKEDARVLSEIINKIIRGKVVGVGRPALQ